MPRWFWPLAALCIVWGAVGGYLTVPHYYRPPSDGYARLRDRAAQYYRASHQLDLAAMQLLFTPAHQLGSAKELQKVAQANRERLKDESPGMVKSQAAEAANILPQNLKVQAEGDWAVVTGSYQVPGTKDNPSLTLPVKPSVWVRTNGDWWTFLEEPDELACYGNPPDFARDIVARHNFNQEARQMLPPTGQPQPQPQGASAPPAPPAQPAPGGSHGH
jgi:hypothetical protein